MAISWGYSPKVEKYIPLGDFPADRYLIIAQQVIENLGWKLSHLSASGIIAYTGLSAASYSEEISIRINSNFAIFKSECIGIQLLFTDYGKNAQNQEKFFAEFEYVQFHLKDIWQDRISGFNTHVATQDDAYFNQAPLKVKDRIKNIFYLFWPQNGYLVTPAIVNLNIAYFFLIIGVLVFTMIGAPADPVAAANKVYLMFGIGERNHILKGEFWRLLTQQFIHFSFSHLFFNLYALIYIGLMIENKLGSGKTLAIYLLSGTCGSIFSIYTHHNGLIAGASGAILGMFGAFLALLVSNAFEKNANKALLISTLILVAYMLISGYFSLRADNTAHIAGLISGFLFGYLLYNSILLTRPVSLLARSAIIGMSMVVVLALTYKFLPRYQTEEYEKLKQEYVRNDEVFSSIFFKLGADLSSQDKLEVIRKSAIAPIDSNIALLRKMSNLTLLEPDQADLSYRIKVAGKSHVVALSLYNFYKAGGVYNRQLKQAIQDNINEINKLKYEQSQ